MTTGPASERLALDLVALALEGLNCVVCLRRIDADPDAVNDARSPICGECSSARNFDELLWEVAAADGELDGREVNDG